MLNRFSSLKASYNPNFSLERAVRDLISANDFSEKCQIPWIIWLLENPQSLLALPGKINLYNHDCLHILLDRKCQIEDEAFVIGFTMGNDSKTNRLHLLIFKFFAKFLYPLDYRFNSHHLRIFDLGVIYGKKITNKNLNQVDFKLIKNRTVQQCRDFFGIEWQDINQFTKLQKELLNPRNRKRLSSYHINFLFKSSS